MFSKGLCKSCWNRKYGKPLERTALKKKPQKELKRTPLKRSTKPIKKVADKRQKQLAEYYKLREAFLKKHKECELKVDSGCTRIATEIHHEQGRWNELLLDVTKFKAGCRHCHDRVTEKSKEAIENGQSISRHKKT